MSAPEKPLLAYSVQTDEHGCVRFASSGAAARREGARVLDAEWEEIETCRRAPQFDHLSPGPVSNEDLWAAGWSFPCAVCERRTNDDGTGKWFGGEAYCENHLPASASETEAKQSGMNNNSEETPWIA